MRFSVAINSRWIRLEHNTHFTKSEQSSETRDHGSQFEMVLTAEHESMGRSHIQIQLLPPYIHLKLTNSAPCSLNPPLIPKPNPNLHPLDRDPTPPRGSQ